MHRSLLALAVVGTLTVAACSSGDDSQADDAGGPGTAAGQTDTAEQNDSSGDPADLLHKMVRAHGNASEYVAMLAVLIMVVGMREPSAWANWSMIGATVSRYLHAVGMIVSPTLDKPQPLRFAGALGTYVFGMALCVALLRSL